MFRLIAVVLLVLFQGGETFKGRVIGVTDGDSIVVLTEDKQQLKIRLEGIDCPESGHDYGSRAKEATVALCFQKDVTIKKTGEDLYGRTLGYAYVGDLCVNKELLKLGMAWHFKKYNKDPELARIEVEARGRGVGLWAVDNPVAPWEWRRQ